MIGTWHRRRLWQTLTGMIVLTMMLSACGTQGTATATHASSASAKQAAASTATSTTGAVAAGQKKLVWLLPTDPLLDPWATKTAIPLFEKSHPNVTIQVIMTPHVGQKLLAMEAAGTPPDIFTDWGTAQFRQLYNSHQLLNLTPVINANKLNLSAVLPSVLSHYVENGNTYGIPWLANPITIGYNASLFGQYHVALPPDAWSDTSWTTDLLLQDAAKLTHNRANAPETIWGVQWAGIRDLPWLWGADYYNSQGGPFSSPAYTTGKITYLGMSNPKVVAAIQWYVDLIYKDRVNPPPSDLAALSTLGASISSGRVAMEVLPANAVVRTAMTDKFKFKWGIAPLPYGPGKSDQSSVNENAWLVSAKTKHPKAATEFTVFLATLPGKESPAVYGFLGPTKSSFETWAKEARSLPNFDMPPGALTKVVWDEMKKPLIYNPADAFDHIAEMNTAWTQLMAPVFNNKEGVLAGLEKVQAKYAQIAGCGACRG
ncbi:MAG: extracellular solute-binding protein [Chloroflexi bacterium]|nr:extracellular solute-binding protein [Chloroflexota bacterium]